MASSDSWLSSQFLNAEIKDLEVVVESEGNPSLLSVFPAHRLVLRSLSPVLNTMVNSSCAESSQTPRLKVKDNVSSRTVEYFMRFIYLKYVPKLIHFENLCELLSMSVTYEISGLAAECEKRLRSSISVDNVCQLYETASRLNARELVEACRDFISANCQVVLGNDLHFALLEEQRLMQVLCKTPKTLAKDHEWNKKTKEGEFQRKAVLRWKTWICCVRGVSRCDTLDTALEIQAVDHEVSPYSVKSDSANWIPGLYMDTSLCDVELLVDEKATFPVHSLVLIKKSEVFLSMWNEVKRSVDLNKSAVLQIELKNINARTMEYMLRFLYTQDLPTEISDTSLMNLLLAAHRFELAPLEKICVQTLQRKVSLTNCCPIMELAERLDIKTLSDFCYKRILDNAEKIFRNQLHFALSKQALVKVLTRRQCTAAEKEWCKWRCCHLGVIPDDDALSEMTKTLLSELVDSVNLARTKSDQQQSKRNSGPTTLLFNRNDKEQQDKQEVK